MTTRLLCELVILIKKQNYLFVSNNSTIALYDCYDRKGNNMTRYV